MRTRTLLMLVALAPLAAACTPDGYGRSSGSVESARPWAPLPPEVALPEAAPDDPLAYRGVRFRIVHGHGPTYVESAGQPVPWLEPAGGSYQSVAPAPRGPFFGHQLVSDGRRRMAWFFRLVEPPAPPAPPAPPERPPMPATTGPPPPAPPVGDELPPPRSGPPAPPSPPLVPVQPPPGPLRAVLDVLVLPDDPNVRFDIVCGFGPVLLDDGAVQRFNRRTGRLEPFHPGHAHCAID